MILTYIFIFVLGAAVGSFLNVCIHRLPMEKSIISPASNCPQCRTSIKFYDNIPILSFLMLRGRCRDCGTSISAQYILIELINGAGYVLIAWKFGFNAETAFYALLFSSLLTASVIDLYHQIIPDVITIPGIIIGLAASALILPAGIKSSFFGILLGGGLFFVIAVASRGGMGGGDIKLIAMIGSFLGLTDVLITIVLSSFIGSLVGIFIMIFFGKGRKYKIPFGPFLAFGGIMSLFFKAEIIEWYFGMDLWHY
ncbi:MAG: prepilin peptidase [Nitrospirae bacterium]|nr:prepilin peptidase [Nitrospirota bacterium]